MSIKLLFVLLSLMVTLLFFLYGYNSYYLLSALRRYRSPQGSGDGTAGGYAPRVAIHLPIYNEKYVVRRLVEACAKIAEEYGREKVRILAIDDSDDDTTAELRAAADEQRARGIAVEVIHRQSRAGFKAGALQLALERSDEELFAVFDADFIPPADFLKRTVPFFQKDGRLGVVQSRWDHINGDFNYLTRAISIGIDMHFFIEQPARYAAGCFLNFNGSGGLIRREALEKAGGWQSDTLAEDLDASYRMQLEGYRVIYLKDLRCPGEVPLTVPSYKKQQARWACGSLRTAKKILPRLLADSTLGVRKRIQAFIHLTYYMIHPLMLTSFILSTLSVLLRIDGLVSFFPTIPAGRGLGEAALSVPLLPLLWLAVAVCTVSFWIYPLVAVHARGRKIRREIPAILLLAVIGFGVSLSNTIEAAKALFTNRVFKFKRTPKYNIRAPGADWRARRYQVPLDAGGILEAAMAGLGIAATAIGAGRSIYWPLLLIAPYTFGYGFVALLTFLQSGKKEALDPCISKL